MKIQQITKIKNRGVCNRFLEWLYTILRQKVSSKVVLIMNNKDNTPSLVNKDDKIAFRCS